MEDVSNHYYQDTGMTKIQAENLMEALAKFHATHWRKENENSNCLDERGTFWVLSRRQPLGKLAPIVSYLLTTIPLLEVYLVSF